MQASGRMTEVHRTAARRTPDPEHGRNTPTALSGARAPVLVTFEGAEMVDLDRLERGLALVAERVGEGRYRVTGGSQDHWVDLVTAAHPRCDCGDHVWRDQVCKHILAALLREGNEHVVRALATVVARAREAAPARVPRAA